MKTEFTDYPKAKRVYQQLAAQGHPYSIELLEDAKILEESHGPFFSAYLILETYKKAIEVKNATKENNQSN